MRAQGVAVVMAASMLAAAGTAAAGPALPIADFTYGQNWRGGFHGPFARVPSAAATRRVADVVHRPGGYALRVSATRQPDGFAGAFVNFYDHRPATCTYLDASAYNTLSFWVRGAVGGEEFTVKVADEQWILREDAFDAGPIRDFLPGGVTTQWQQVVVPLGALPLDVRKLGALNLSFNLPGQYVVYVDDIALQSLPIDLLPNLNFPASRAPGRAVWQWDSRRQVADPAARADFFAFAAREQIRRVWMLLPHTDAQGVPTDGVTSLAVNRDALRALLADAHQRGIAVEVLDGAPQYALAENHGRPLALVDAVIAFNDAAPQGQQFDGVHFDIEPYLLPGWPILELREQILAEYLDLGVESRRRLALAGIAFGVDVPYWWQDAASAGVTYGGVRKAAALHCIDRFDNVGIMNYQLEADGRSGMIARGTGLLAYADQVRRARVFMGTETTTMPATDFLWEAALAENDFRRYAFFAGTALHHYASYRALVESGVVGAQEVQQGAVEGAGVLQGGKVAGPGNDLERAAGNPAVDRLRVRYRGEGVLRAADDQRRNADLPQRRRRVRAGG
jgi:hypothetical protein